MKKLKSLKLQKLFFSFLTYLSFVGVLFFIFIFVRLDNRFPTENHDSIFLLINSFKIVFVLLIFTVMILSTLLKKDTDKRIALTIKELKAKEKANRKKKKKSTNKKKNGKQKKLLESEKDFRRKNKFINKKKKSVLKFTKTKNYGKIKNNKGESRGLK